MSICYSKRNREIKLSGFRTTPYQITAGVDDTCRAYWLCLLSTFFLLLLSHKKKSRRTYSETCLPSIKSRRWEYRQKERYKEKELYTQVSRWFVTRVNISIVIRDLRNGFLTFWCLQTIHIIIFLTSRWLSFIETPLLTLGILKISTST